jgi:hypothetical protein
VTDVYYYYYYYYFIIITLLFSQIYTAFPFARIENFINDTYIQLRILFNLQERTHFVIFRLLSRTDFCMTVQWARGL